MALLETPAVRRIETALNNNISKHKRVTKDDVQCMGVQISHQMVKLCGTCSFDMFEKLDVTFVDVFVEICIKFRLFAYTRRVVLYS
jgi:hypothetical protein